MMEKATFAAGCFWHVEAAYRSINGVINTLVGYTGGSYPNPTYEDVCSDKTGHAESVEIEFDPAVIAYDDLLRVFWGIHDPTTPNRQGPDVGSQYRSAIFYHSPEQEAAAVASKERLQASEEYRGRRIVTEVVPASTFYPAEGYHQRYLEKRGRVTCRVC
jgi:peptide-methionine (S)-S-oxide reductase